MFGTLLVWQTPLEFDQTIGTSLVWNNGTRYNFKNVFVSTGTWPAGSTWCVPILGFVRALKS